MKQVTYKGKKYYVHYTSDEYLLISKYKDKNKGGIFKVSIEDVND